MFLSTFISPLLFDVIGNLTHLCHFLMVSWITVERRKQLLQRTPAPKVLAGF